MNLVDSDNRWIYKGSVTTPPCATFVYWNVLSTVYPISQKHLDQFKAQLNLGENGQLASRGNYRETQKINRQGVVYIRREDDSQTDKYENLKKGGLITGIVLLSLMITALLLLIVCISLCYNQKHSRKTQKTKRSSSYIQESDEERK